jgi:hypothetical protein
MMDTDLRIPAELFPLVYAAINLVVGFPAAHLAMVAEPPRHPFGQ